MSMNLHLHYIDNNGKTVKDVDLYQTPTIDTYRILGLAHDYHCWVDSQGKESFVKYSDDNKKDAWKSIPDNPDKSYQGILSRYTEWLKTRNPDCDDHLEYLNTVQQEYSNYTPEWYYL